MSVDNNMIDRALFFDITLSFSVVYWLPCFPLDPTFTGSNPAEDDGFLRAIQIHSTTSFEGKVKPSAPCKILRHGKDPLTCDRDTDRQNSEAISSSVSPRFAARCLCCNNSRELWWMNQD
jgi:hypothetical protein